MRKSQQMTSRQRSARTYRKQAQNRKLRRWWKAMIVEPLKRISCNTRIYRSRRLEATLAGKSTNPIMRRVRPDWNKMPAANWPPIHSNRSALRTPQASVWPPVDCLPYPEPSQALSQLTEWTEQVKTQLKELTGLPLYILQQMATTDPEQARYDFNALGTSILILPE
jgi:hypothetical protein